MRKEYLIRLTYNFLAKFVMPKNILSRINYLLDKKFNSKTTC
jgi:hypothetical protein